MAKSRYEVEEMMHQTVRVKRDTKDEVLAHVKCVKWIYLQIFKD